MKVFFLVLLYVGICLILSSECVLPKKRAIVVFLLMFYDMLICVPLSVSSFKYHRLIYDQLPWTVLWSRVEGVNIITQNK